MPCLRLRDSVIVPRRGLRAGPRLRAGTVCAVLGMRRGIREVEEAQAEEVAVHPDGSLKSAADAESGVSAGSQSS